MIKISENANINYMATIVKIDEMIEIKESRNLAYAKTNGNLVIVNKTTVSPGDIMIYFPIGSQISDWFLHHNNLFREKTANRDTEIQGYFDKHGRVKPLTLKEHISNGFMVGTKAFDGDFLFQNHIGESFDTFNNRLLVKKYIVPTKTSGTPGTRNCSRIKPKHQKVDENYFHFHIKTPQIYNKVNSLDPNGIYTITRKMHGTSGISANVICNLQDSWPVRFNVWLSNNITYPILSLFGPLGSSSVQTKDYDNVYSSRTVIKNDKEDQGFYGEDVWAHADKLLKPFLLKGMTMYYEIVGYLPSGKMIQKGYNYGCLPPNGNYRVGINYRVLVYRITMAEHEGEIIEWDTNMMRLYCAKHNIETVPEYFRGTMYDFLNADIQPLDAKEVVTNSVDWSTVDGDDIIGMFMDKVSKCYLEKEAKDCDNLPDEGVVLRREDSWNLDVCKYKSRKFILAESREQDKNIVNIEDEA